MPVSTFGVDTQYAETVDQSTQTESQFRDVVRYNLSAGTHYLRILPPYSEKGIYAKPMGTWWGIPKNMSKRYPMSLLLSYPDIFKYDPIGHVYDQCVAKHGRRNENWPISFYPSVQYYLNAVAMENDHDMDAKTNDAEGYRGDGSRVIPHNLLLRLTKATMAHVSREVLANGGKGDEHHYGFAIFDSIDENGIYTPGVTMKIVGAKVQNSNRVTYTVDWGKKPIPLHRERDVIDMLLSPPQEGETTGMYDLERDGWLQPASPLAQYEAYSTALSLAKACDVKEPPEPDYVLTPGPRPEHWTDDNDNGNGDDDNTDWGDDNGNGNTGSNGGGGNTPAYDPDEDLPF